MFYIICIIAVPILIVVCFTKIVECFTKSKPNKTECTMIDGTALMFAKVLRRQKQAQIFKARKPVRSLAYTPHEFYNYTKTDGVDGLREARQTLKKLNKGTDALRVAKELKKLNKEFSPINSVKIIGKTQICHQIADDKKNFDIIMIKAHVLSMDDFIPVKEEKGKG